MAGVWRTVAATFLALCLIAGPWSGPAHAAEAGEWADAYAQLWSVYHVVERAHVNGADLDAFIEGAIQGGLEALGDPYTEYFEPAEYKAFLESLDGTLTGIGVYLEEVDGYIVITQPIKGSPAAEAGLQPGDRVIAADGVNLVGEPIEKMQRLVRGEPGTDVELTIERPAEGRRFNVTITRAVIHIPQVDYRMLDGGVGYLELSGFGDQAAEEFYAAVAALKEAGATSLVLDLRSNSGGWVASALEIAEAFVPEGEPIMYEMRKAGQWVFLSEGQPIGLPTAVLVSGFTASAAEILAGAIQDYEAGVLVGTQTFGKGTVQELIELPDGAAVKVTTAEYLTGKQRRVHGVGLTPDVVVEPYRPDPDLATPLTSDRVLTNGHVGLDVLGLQRRLTFLGYRTDLDGYFKGQTAWAVRQFARDNGLNDVPMVDSVYLDRLNAAVAAKLKAADWPDLQLEAAIAQLTAKH
ncbi:carboxyl-terminal processing protease [Symbiobacterium terraclitae]|uniref:Carboxyl-terminal processing protease n=1 Tax=Symbiobacterium terraclitae TaxID=557451 RepID=A0ABS4JWR4_9FIRM|nr:S41 family peptidase [Symbiobacterium terraclitae]MBP2019975.1 carboxyl-terminal processing protease [Symbiobacterium terraclitae]